MKRLFTAFVSSTFTDLQDERQRLVRLLLGQQCVPFGMEFFPSTGRSQWPIIEESIEAADFCVFVVAGRYGTLSDEGGISWTHREFREAARRGKPLIGILHAAPGDLPVNKSESTDEGRAALASFREEIEAHTVCRYYRDDTDLVEALSVCIGALRDEGRIEGWVPAGRNPVVLQETDFDRVYELVEIDWRFVRSTRNPETWDAEYRARRRIMANDPEGLATCTIDFTRETDRQLPFDTSRRPELKLVEFSRSGPGFLTLRPPRKQRGGTFAQEVAFNPSLSPSEVVDFTIEGRLPSYKYGVREDLVKATMDSKIGPRAFDWTSHNVSYPTRRLTICVFLPLALNATPRGPMIGRGAGRIDPDLNNQVVEAGGYSCELEEIDGERGYRLRLAVPDPVMRTRYRVGWDLPSRKSGKGELREKSRVRAPEASEPPSRLS